MAFYDLVANKVPERFPDLRIGFIETNSSWVPFVFHYLNRRTKSGRSAWGPHIFRDYRLYVACEVDEDLPYILKYVGEDNLIVGSDYTHADQSMERHFQDELWGRVKNGDLTAGVVDKMLYDNPKRLYGL